MTLNPEISLLNLICQEKVTDVDCSGSLARASLSIVLQQNGGLVFLVQDVLLDIVPLFFHKELGPKDHLCQVVGTYQFRLRAVSGRVVRPADGNHARFIANRYLRMKHGHGRCNGIEMISRGLLNKSSLFRYITLHAV